MLNTTKAKLIYRGLYHILLYTSPMLFSIYIPSKLVVPEFIYNKLVPNKIKHELKPLSPQNCLSNKFK